MSIRRDRNILIGDKIYNCINLQVVMKLFVNKLWLFCYNTLLKWWIVTNRPNGVIQSKKIFRISILWAF